MITLSSAAFGPVTFAAGYGAVTPPSAATTTVASDLDEHTSAPDDAFARLVALVESNDRLRAELGTLDGRLAEAKAYAFRPDANPALAHARLAQVRRGRSRVLAALRSNRIAAAKFLAPASS